MPGFKQLVLKAQLNHKKMKLLQANDAVSKLKQTLANKNKVTLTNASSDGGLSQHSSINIASQSAPTGLFGADSSSSQSLVQSSIFQYSSNSGSGNGSIFFNYQPKKGDKPAPSCIKGMFLED